MQEARLTNYLISSRTETPHHFWQTRGDGYGKARGEQETMARWSSQAAKVSRRLLCPNTISLALPAPARPALTPLARQLACAERRLREWQLATLRQRLPALLAIACGLTRGIRLLHTTTLPSSFSSVSPASPTSLPSSPPAPSGVINIPLQPLLSPPCRFFAQS